MDKKILAPTPLYTNIRRLEDITNKYGWQSKKIKPVYEYYYSPSGKKSTQRYIPKNNHSMDEYLKSAVLKDLDSGSDTETYSEELDLNLPCSCLRSGAVEASESTK